MAFENSEPVTIIVCVDCVYFNEYGRLDDTTMAAWRAEPLRDEYHDAVMEATIMGTAKHHDAATEHAAKIAAIWSAGTEFTSGCGLDCEDHGLAAFGGDEDAREAAQDNGPDTWFSWSACEQCDSPLGGTREHATAWIPNGTEH